MLELKTVIRYQTYLLYLVINQRLEKLKKNIYTQINPLGHTQKGTIRTPDHTIYGCSIFIAQQCLSRDKKTEIRCIIAPTVVQLKILYVCPHVHVGTYLPIHTYIHIYTQIYREICQTCKFIEHAPMSQTLKLR